MKFDCGLTDERPDLDPAFNWVRTAPVRSMPQRIVLEWQTLFATPGFPIKFFESAFNISEERAIMLFHLAADKAQENMPLISENWLSITRDDCKILMQRRNGQGHIPLCVRMQIASDLKANRSQPEIAKEYGIHWRTVQNIGLYGPFGQAKLPDWFNPSIF